ncbi:MAG: hypothetical protein EBT03_07925 [Betaproteobacteria bacterium]|jgi:hypothetical protein|nr:hypothetical protein [Betaproteobacteria bacterium]NCA16973.1 hypothetical protein [Betaproteobacteria bacterium]
MTPEDFSHDNVKETVAFRGSPLAIKTKQGWYPLMGNPDALHKAATRAIWSLPDAATAEEIRHAIVERLFERTV